MSDNKRITMDGFSSKILTIGLSQGELAQKGFTSANLQAALKQPAESQPKDGSNGGDQAGAAQKK